MSHNYEIKISVRNLVEFILRGGDLDSRFRGSNRAVEGTRAHQKVQSSMGENYTPEVHLKHSFEYKDFSFIVEGRADGIIHQDDEVIIDEIKSTTRPLEFIDEDYNILHWAQAQCYGYIYAKDNSLDTVTIQLTYYQLETEQVKRIDKVFSFIELKDFFFGLIDQYLVWANYTRDWSIERNESIKNLEFPFPTYRRGQRSLAVAVYRTIVEEKRLFAQAPTGIGKTISTLFPAIKAIGEGHSSKIFYLTAKTITRQVVEEATKKMQGKGLHLKSITLTAKDKICFKEQSNCNPEVCEYAKGHFNRVNDALMDILRNENVIVRETVEEYSYKHKVCPFELSLDIALWADCVICDYNYAFDPRVYLKRFFSDNSGDYIFLVDEAHNLVDRSREMFSAQLNKKPILELKRIMKEKDKRIAKALNQLNSFMLKQKKKCEEKDFYIQKEEIDETYGLLRKLIYESEEWLEENEKTEGYEELLQLYFDALAYIKISEFYDERYVSYIEKENKDVKLKIYCVDPSYLLGEAIKRGKSAVFFSATLTPLDYFRNILGGNEEDYIMALASPFDVRNRELLISNNISTRYNDRDKTYEVIAAYLNSVLEQKVGNYLVFFPSYQYMNNVYEYFKASYPNVNTIIQSTNMTEIEREDFLGNFSLDNQESLLGFAVLGGIFSEGVDLTGERLSGAIIVGVGLPKICLERDIIRGFFDEGKNLGFEYAYMYPGMNKVLQAAGRVIRTENDKGVILLIDDRFNYRGYKGLFPKHWEKNRVVRNEGDIKKYIKNFWNS